MGTHHAPACPSTGTIDGRELRVMGGRAHVTVHGGDADLLDRAEQRLRDLESRWSRFVPDSDITRANRSAGTPVRVHPETVRVVSRAITGWRQTDGRFDVTVLPALLSQGYTHSALSGALAPAVPGAHIGLSSWIVADIAASTVTVPATSAIDLGGIGKGYAADLVAEELVAAGASGAMVNVGGDISMRGAPADGADWLVGVEDPTAVPSHVAVLRMVSGGIATSGTTIRKWSVEGDAPGVVRHHLIDPRTTRSADTGTMTATVLAGDCATAEIFATSAMLLDPIAAVQMVDAAGLAGLVVAADGTVHRSRGLGAFEFGPLSAERCGAAARGEV
jgi:thiamine biosynthesis lipoprotein